LSGVKGCRMALNAEIWYSHYVEGFGPLREGGATSESTRRLAATLKKASLLCGKPLWSRAKRRQRVIQARIRSKNPSSKEKLMPEPRTCHLPTNTALFCTCVQRLDQSKALQRHCPDIVVSNRTELEGRR